MLIWSINLTSLRQKKPSQFPFPTCLVCTSLSLIMGVSLQIWEGSPHILRGVLGESWAKEVVGAKSPPFAVLEGDVCLWALLEGDVCLWAFYSQKTTWMKSTACLNQLTISSQRHWTSKIGSQLFTICESFFDHSLERKLTLRNFSSSQLIQALFFWCFSSIAD